MPQQLFEFKRPAFLAEVADDGSLEETGQVLGTSLATTMRDWQAARAWLFRRRTRGRPAQDAPSRHPVSVSKFVGSSRVLVRRRAHEPTPRRNRDPCPRCSRLQ